MSHPHSHSHSHSHSDNHNHEGHDHTQDLTPAIQSTLYSQIDFDQISVLNERDPGSGKAVVRKTWAERLEPQPVLVSDADEQVLISVP